MKSPGSELQSNQHLNSEQVRNLFLKLGFNEGNITTITQDHQDIDTIDNLRNILSNNGYQEGKVVVFRINGNGRKFLPDEERYENNHYVGIYFKGNQVHYIDPTGSGISESVRNVVATSHESLGNKEMISSNAVLQYTKEIHYPTYQMRGNDKDCGVLLPLAIDLIKRDTQNKDSIRLNEEDSRNLGVLLREVAKGKSIQDVGQNIGQILQNGVVDQEKRFDSGATDRERKTKLFADVKLWHLDLKTLVKYNQHPNKPLIQESFSLPSEITARDWANIAKEQKKATMEALKDYYSVLHPENPNPFVKILQEFGNFIDKDIHIQFDIQEILFREATEIQKGKTIQKGIIEGLKRDQFIKDESEVELKPAGSGKSGCQTAVIQGKKYYIKPFSYSSEHHPSNSRFSLCSPKEALLYKILEKINFGPKTNFLLSSGSSIEGSIQKGNYIITEEVPNLFLDNLKGKEIFDAMKKSKDKEDVVELSCASVLKGLLSLGDIFPDNNENYGITTDKKFMFIDHHPSTNGDFVDKGDELNMTREQEYSPRMQMSEMCNRDKYQNALSGNLSDIKDTSYPNFASKVLAKDVNDRLFAENNIEQAVDLAGKEMQDLIKRNQGSFTENAEKETLDLVAKIQKNIENYKRTEYAKQGGMSM